MRRFQSTPAGTLPWDLRLDELREQRERFLPAEIAGLGREPLHGWAIGLRLRSISGDVLQVSEGSLYPALHKLEQEGWITAEWKQTENNRRAKFYSLTRLGKKQLETETVNWQRLSSAISHVVQLSEA